MEAEKKPPVVSDMGAWAMNVVSSVGIIMANKQLMSSSGYAFAFATTLTGFHFTVTALVGWISNATGYSVSKHVPLWELVWFSLVANTSITGMNLSLMLNSVGFYQISKLSMIPVVCLMEWVLNSKHYTTKVISAVIVVAAGVGICTVTDVEKKYNIGSFELLSKTAPIQALSLIILGPFVDYYLNGQSLLKYNFSGGATFFILLSCSLAVFCNMSQYLCIGRFSATSFQVLGHMKTVCVLILGWILFDSALTVKNILGMLLAVMGMVVYSWAVESEKKAASPIPRNKSDMLDGEDVPLKARVSGLPSVDLEEGEMKS
ncbi:UDP-galactose transporter 2 [Dichanthelium oligosanthes]|uniref:UDP-galactose transporter 2 n=1 Tax=Dichanthelium oligosanthes TaxID=888268 RepID=A0A1E5VQD3_9POAL|nr:UDP-galactose transporter 2 [Dichanthelium oligosanthes]